LLCYNKIINVFIETVYNFKRGVKLMRRVNFSKTGGRNRRKNAILIAVAIILLILIFFLSFIISYNVMSTGKKKTANTNDSYAEMGISLGEEEEELPTDVTELQKQIEALNEEIEYLNSQIEK
jgi:cell division protein FtsB